MARAKPAKTLGDLLERICGSPPRWESTSDPDLSIAVLAAFPNPASTTFVTRGLARTTRSMWRGLSVGFELVAIASERVGELRARLEEVALADRADRAPHLRHVTLPPRGLMVNGAFQARRAPHLVYVAEGLPRGLDAQARVGEGWIEFLRVVPITSAELAEYDAGPGDFIAKIRPRYCP